MEKINFMEHLTKKKALKETNYKEFSDTNENKKTLSSLEKRKLCDEYLIPLLYSSFANSNTIFSEAIKTITNKTQIKKLFTSKNEMLKEEKIKTFVYQTCLNFVSDYSGFISTKRLKEETKQDLIINAFKYSKDFHRDLIRVSNDYIDFEDGCYITIDLNKISNDY